MEKRLLDRRLGDPRGRRDHLPDGVHIGVRCHGRRISIEDFDAVVLAGGATAPRDLPVPGRELAGVHFAMELSDAQNRRCEGDGIDLERSSRPRASSVVIIGGGDTGADCLGTVASPGGAVGAPVRAAAAAARRARGGQPVAGVAATSSACRRPTRKAANACISVSTERLHRRRPGAAVKALRGRARRAR